MTDFTPLFVCLPMIIIIAIIWCKKPICKQISSCRKRKRIDYVVTEYPNVYYVVAGYPDV